MKKCLNLFTCLLIGLLTACSSESSSVQSASVQPQTASNFGEITVISRESGSGTRDAFTELTGILEKDAEGNKSDKTTIEAIIMDGTQAVMTQVSQDINAIGYISLGSLNESVKAVKVEGVEATAENVKSGSYILQRPFNIATKSELSGEAADFVNYIMSEEGQSLIYENGYIAVQEGEPFESTMPSGKISVVGSSSVSPVMEKLIEAYNAVNPNLTIELQTLDSTAGINAAMEGVCDIGMASRDLKDDEKETLVQTTIAKDGIAVIVNKENSRDNLTMAQIKSIFTGESTDWSQIN